MTARWEGPVLPHPLWHSRYASSQPDLHAFTDILKGVNGLTARDIKLVIEGGYNTVEAIAYTYVDSHATN